MTSNRLRTTALASLTLAGAGLVGIVAPADAVRAPQATSAAGSSPAPGPVGGPIVRRDSDKDVPAAVAAAVQRTLTSPGNRTKAAADAGQIVVPIRAHIIVGTRKRDRRHHATKRQVRQQVAWMNLAYSGGEQPGVAADTGIRFRLRSISTTKNNSWFHLRKIRQLNQMKAHLHKGGRRTLNIYFAQLPGGLLGISRFPWQYKASKKLDGVVMAYNAVRGGSLAGYNEGDTAVHETGHWLGLLHTFQGGCAAPGDYVDDTAPEAGPQYQPAERDSCPGDPFVDPVHNFMDYPPDFFMTQFTPGQATRMQQAVAAYR